MSGRITSIAVFCGAARGNRPEYLAAAGAAGAELARRGIDVVFGGSHLGLMGAVADAALAAGGRVVGVIPTSLQARERVHDGLTELVVVDSMHERKLQMSRRADAFLALPGGPGTLEEITEQWTWAQLGIHDKPCGVLDVLGYYAPLRALVDSMSTRGFTHQRYTDLLVVDDDLDRIIDGFQRHVPPTPAIVSPGQDQDSVLVP